MKMGGSCLKASFIFLLCCALNSRVTDSETSYTWRLDQLANGEGKIVADLGLGSANMQAKAEEVAKERQESKGPTGRAQPTPTHRFQ